MQVLRKKKGKKTDATIILTLIVLFSGIISILYDIILNIIALSIQSTNFFCTFTFFTKFIKLIIFEWIVSFYWYVRLNNTFNNSALEMNKICNISIIIFIIISGISIALLSFFVVSPNFNAKDNGVCKIVWEQHMRQTIFLIEFIILTWSFMFSFIFWQKLRYIILITLYYIRNILEKIYNIYIILYSET